MLNRSDRQTSFVDKQIQIQTFRRRENVLEKKSHFGFPPVEVIVLQHARASLTHILSPHPDRGDENEDL